MDVIVKAEKKINIYLTDITEVIHQFIYYIHRLQCLLKYFTLNY